MLVQGVAFLTSFFCGDLPRLAGSGCPLVDCLVSLNTVVAIIAQYFVDHVVRISGPFCGFGI